MILRELFTKIGFKVDDSALKGVQSGIDGINSKINLLVGFEIAKKLVHMSQSFAEWGQQLRISAESIGITTGALQAFQFMGEKAGVSAATMSGTLANMTKMLAGMQKFGDNGQWLTFARLQISPEKVMSWKTGADMMYDVADALENVKDVGEKMYLASQLGLDPSMISLMSKGSKTLRGEFEAAGKAGISASEGQRRGLERLNEVMVRGRYFVDKFWMDIASNLAPALSTVVEKVIAWYSANRELVQANIYNFMLTVARAIGFVIGSIQALVSWYEYLFKAKKEEKKHWLENAAKMMFFVWAAIKLISVIATVAGWFDKLYKVSLLLGKGLTGLVTGGWALLVKGIPALALRLAALTESAFPALSRMLLHFGASMEAVTVGSMAAFVGSVSFLGLALESLYQALTGKTGKLTGWLDEL